MSQQFNIFADHHQFYIQDDDIAYGDLSAAWSPEATERMLAVAPHTIGVGTVRNMTVAVSIQIYPFRPTIDVNQFSRINDAVIQIDTGRIVLAGCTDYFPAAARIQCTPGLYNAIVGYKNVTVISADGLDGDDSYWIFLWPANQ